MWPGLGFRNENTDVSGGRGLIGIQEDPDTGTTVSSLIVAITG